MCHNVVKLVKSNTKYCCRQPDIVGDNNTILVFSDCPAFSRQPDIEATRVVNKADNLIKCNLKMYLFGYVFFFYLLFLVRNNIFRLKRSKKKFFIKMYIIEPTTERTGERRESFGVICSNQEPF